jgi:hypothetical protein
MTGSWRMRISIAGLHADVMTQARADSGVDDPDFATLPDPSTLDTTVVELEEHAGSGRNHRRGSSGGPRREAGRSRELAAQGHPLRL